MFRRFLRDRSGSTVTTFAVALIPMVGAIGGAVDFTRAYDQKVLVQDSLDTAALASAKLLGIQTSADVEKEAKAFFTANIEGKLSAVPSLTTTITAGSVQLNTKIKVPTYFLGLFGLKEIVFDMMSKTVAGAATYEVVLALDNTGSMSGSKITSLRQAATDLVNTLFSVNANNPKPNPLKIGLVPFAAAVNVGPQYQADAGATWLDKDGKGTYHLENFQVSPDTPATSVTGNRFTLFSQLKNITWAGCVEARPYPYDVNDTAPSSTDAKSLFVPMFAPDEPSLSGYDNDYIEDKSSACTTTRDKAATAKSNAAQVQARLCKYKNSDSLPNGNSNGTVIGPNINCTSRPLVPMTANKNVLLNAIAAMPANGLTNIHSGVTWGWKLLSPTAPFTEGRAYKAEDNNKILIVMTDGENTYDTYSNINDSMYGAFGYVAKQHLGTSDDNDDVIEKMDSYTLETCTNMKAQTDIRIYTIGFQMGTAGDAVNLLRNCATNPQMAYLSNTNAELISVFQQIAQDISELRLEK